MSGFLKRLPEWNNPGVEPPQVKKDGGWMVDERPPSAYMNWLSNQTFEALKELQENAVHIKAHMALNVMDLGAKGDGVTNDYGVIQAALDTGKPVFIPYTKDGYAIQDTLLVKTGQVIFGQNKRTKIVQVADNIPIVRVIGNHYSITNLYLEFQNQQNESTSGGIGIELGDAATSEGAFEGVIERVVIEKPYRGLSIPTWAGSAFAFMNTFQQIRVLDAWDYAFYLSSTGIGLTTNTLRNCYALFQSGEITNPNAKGFYIGNHDDFTMDNCACDHAMEEALTLVNNMSGTILSFHAEGCRISKDWQALVKVVNSNIKFNSLQLPYNIINAGVNEGYFLWAFENSTVLIDFMTERDTTKNSASGSFFSTVKDDTSAITISKLTSVFPTI